MASMPETPGRGRSRFSKVLPLPPGAEPAEKSPASFISTISTNSNSIPTKSPLPAPIPPSKLSLPPIVHAVPRRPLGMTAEQKALSAALARATNSPLITSPTIVQRSQSETSSSTMDTLSTRESELAITPITPPPPPKDNPRQLTKTPEPMPNPELSSQNTVLPLQQPSPPRETLWRRRSTKSDHIINVTELVLDRSNGSTASPPRQEPPKGPLPQLPRSNASSLSNRKPVPVRKAPPQPEFMGTKISKLKDKASSSDRNPFHSSSLSKDDSYHNSNRPPTPEYMNGDDAKENTRDGRSIEPPKVTSPRSPVTPPKDVAPPRIPPRSDSRFAPTIAPLPFGGSVSNGSNSTLQAPEIMHSRESSETLTVTSPQPHQHQQADATKVLTPALNEDAGVSPISPTSPTESTHNRHSRQSKSQSIHFPPTVTAILPEGTVLPSLPLNINHYECYQSHRLMRGSRNSVCPVACMVCGKDDKETRWRCTWCCVSACAGCMQVLTNTEGRDLRVVVDKVAVEIGVQG